MTAPGWSVLLSDPAREDLFRSAQYIAADLRNPPAASRLLDAIEAAIRSLSAHPSRHPLLGFEPWRSRGYQAFLVGRHLPIYRTDTATHTVQIARIFHATQNWKDIMRGFGRGLERAARAVKSEK